jgi:hypothetical protein
MLPFKRSRLTNLKNIVNLRIKYMIEAKPLKKIKKNTPTNIVKGLPNINLEGHVTTKGHFCDA